MTVSIIAARIVSNPGDRLFGQIPESNRLAKMRNPKFGRTGLVKTASTGQKPAGSGCRPEESLAGGDPFAQTPVTP
jgi:hypothetical protein